MPYLHNDPQQHVNELIDCLQQTDRPIAFLVGAGCPCSVSSGTAPLIPAIAGLTQHVENVLTGTDRGTWNKIVQQLKDDGVTGDPNIEHVLSRIRALRPVAGAGSIRGMTSEDLANLEVRICASIKEVAGVSLPAGDNGYRRLAQWISGTGRKEPVELFTTNYDLLLEQALEERSIPYFDGFVGARQPFFQANLLQDERLPPDWARLWKLHGSVNWSIDTVGDRKVIRRGVDSGDAVIHPSHLKYDESRKMPYLALIDRLRKFLLRPSSVLVTAGYSFSDEHINEVIIEGLRDHPSSFVFALLYGPSTNYPYIQKLSRLSTAIRFEASDASVFDGRIELWKVQDDVPSTSLASSIVEWKDTGSGDYQAILHLGNFAVLGELLDLVRGSR